MDIEKIMFLYIYICACMIIFNVIYVFYSKHTDKVLISISTNLTDTIEKQIILAKANKPINDKVQRDLSKKMLNLQYLIAFDVAITELTYRNKELVNQYVASNRKLFVTLATEYQKKTDEKKAYFAYLMSRYKVGVNVDTDVISDVMLSFTNSRSTYVRENALKALYSFGNASYIIRAFRIINMEISHQNIKLLSDGLFSFKGDHSELISVLWKSFHRFLQPIQISIVNYIKMKSRDYKEQFYQLLKDKDIDAEVKFAVIRYFRKYEYEPVLEELIHMITQNHGDSWEFAAVAASAIQNYPCEKTIDTLKIALKSPNWYVRFNAADSLIYLGITPQKLIGIQPHIDRYAKEMIQYRWQVHVAELINAEHEQLVAVEEERS